MRRSSSLQPRERVRRAWLRVVLGLCAGVGLAAAMMVYFGISHRELMRDLQQVVVWPLLVAAAGSLVLLALQTLRWWMVMRPVLSLSYSQAYRALAVGYLFNVLLPARAGDLLRVQYLGNRTGVSRAKLLGTEIVDFCSDKWGWVAAFPIVCLLGAPPPAWLFRALALLSGCVLLAAFILALMGSRLGRTTPAGAAWGPEWLRNLRDGFAVQQWKRLAWLETLIAPLPWLWETGIIWVAVKSIGFSLSPMQAFAVLTAFNLAMVVPSPANIGAFESGGTVALIQFQVPNAAALAFIFLYHLSQVIPSMAAGALVLILEGETLFGRRGVLKATTGRPLPSTREEQERVLARANPAHES
jgi:glycosyltransferase 2 family protein